MTKMSTSSPAPRVRLRRTSEGAQDNILAAAEKILVESGPQNLKLVEVAWSMLRFCTILGQSMGFKPP